MESLNRKKSIVLCVLLAGIAAASVPANECDNWQTLHPEWIFCDDFEDGTPLVREGRYFEYDNDEGEFIVGDGIGVDGSKGMRALFQAGEVGAGNFLLGFGRNPNSYMNNGIRETEDFREIYYRMYLKNQYGWVGSPAKLSRATSFSSATDWSQAMIAHLWSSDDYLRVVPVRCVDPATSLVKCIGYNDFDHMDWLGDQSGVTPIFGSMNGGIWYCIEHHIKLNDPGQANGVQEFWINGNLEARRDGLDFVASYTDYAINAVFFENWWNDGSPQLQRRFFDNIVVSTQPIDVPPEPEPKIIYVDADAPGVNDGTSWHDAFNYLRNALIAAQYSDEIWVAEGVYNPDQDSRYPNGSGRRKATFSLRNGVSIKGGFAGFGQPDPNERDPNTYETILSGDLRGNDGPDFANNGDNSYHIVTASGTNATAMLDGFTITAGNASYSVPPHNNGGGMNNDYGSPTVANCTFSDNSAFDLGGGMSNVGSSPTVTNCTFSDNTSGRGGGMSNQINSNPTLVNCTFSGNFPRTYGGGMYNDHSSPTLTNCTFSGNSAEINGGGMYNEESSPTLTDCTFSDNSAEDSGGGLNNSVNSNSTVTNCTFSGNSAKHGGGMNFHESSPTVTNCTFIGNSAEHGGGGLNNSFNSNSMLMNCTFSDNSAEGGGGIHCYYSYPAIINGTFTSNWAKHGGGMANNNSSPTLTNCTFSGNSSEYGGGGMNNWDYCSPALTNCMFSGNSAEGGGGMVSGKYSNPTVTNCTFSGNSARWQGGGVWNNNNSTSTLTNCILWGNTARYGSQIYNDWGCSASVSYTDVQGGWPGTSNINADPLFVDADNDDLHLLPTSPCIDAGDNTAVPAGVTTDLDGNPRFVDQPEVPDTGNGTTPIVDMGAFEADYIKVSMKFTPKALNLRSKGKWLKAHLVLPEEFSVEDVDADTPTVIMPLGIQSKYMNVFINEDGFVEIEAVFSRYDFCGAVTGNEPVEVMIIALLTTGQQFYGTDIIKITNRAFEHLAIVVSHWLEGDCFEPDLCGGADLNADSVVNFIDFALLDRCCIKVSEK
ncbi:MAG: right-handed parallel beta-helix repeat-containing protein [Planctomycetota bacterium]|jgi:hypothetical protein